MPTSVPSHDFFANEPLQLPRIPRAILRVHQQVPIRQLTDLLDSFLLTDAQRSGVANEAAKGGAASMFGRKTMAIEEARSILGVDANCTLEDVMVRYAKMFEANEKNGSFYLQSKIHRAKERMEAEFLGDGGGMRREEKGAGTGTTQGRRRIARRTRTVGEDSRPEAWRTIKSR